MILLLLYLTPFLLMFLAYYRIFHSLYLGREWRRPLKQPKASTWLYGDQRSTCNMDTRRHCKRTIVTSLIIVGTYLVCYTPNVTYLALSCIDNCPFPWHRQTALTRLIIGPTSFALIIAKSIVDPFIYCYRMREVKNAIKSLFCPRSVSGDHCGRRSTRLTVTNGQPSFQSNAIIAQEQCL